jgi:hypothetical protein
MSAQEHPFIVLFEAWPDSHPPSTSPFFVRTIDNAIGNAVEDSFSSSNPLNTREVHKRDAGLDTSIVGVVIPSLLGVIQLCYQAKGNHIAMATLQLAQVVASSGQAHRVADAVGAGGMTAAGVVGTAASGIALAGTSTVVNGVCALQQYAGGARRWAFSFPSLTDQLATLNPFNRSHSPHTDPQNTHDVEPPLTDRACDLVDGVFAIGSVSDYSEDEVDPLDGIQSEEERVWGGEQVRDNFQEISI